MYGLDQGQATVNPERAKYVTVTHQRVSTECVYGLDVTIQPNNQGPTFIYSILPVPDLVVYAFLHV